MLSREKPTVKEIVADALPASRWIEHLNNDLIKFWETPDAYELDRGLFPTG